MEYLKILWWFLPAFVANAVPVLVQHVPGLRHWTTPIAPQLLGANKTWRGLVCGIAAAMIVAVLQHVLFRHGFFPTLFVMHEGIGTTVYLHDFLSESLLIGFLLGFGALAGDAVESAFKRAIKIAPGRPLPVLDGIDYIVGALVCVWPFVPLGWHQVVFLLVLAPVASLVANIIAYLCGWKKVWW